MTSFVAHGIEIVLYEDLPIIIWPVIKELIFIMLCMTLYNKIHVFKQKHKTNFSEQENAILDLFDFNSNNIYIQPNLYLGTKRILSFMQLQKPPYQQGVGI